MTRVHAALAIAGVLATVFTAAAQQTPPQDDEYFARIEVEGNASGAYPVAAVAFRLDTQIERGTNPAENGVILANLRERMRKALRDAALQPLSVEEKPMVFPVDASAAGWSTWVRITPPAIQTGEDAGEELGRMIQNMREIANAAGCRITGPFFEAEERDVAEQDTLARATENALYRAEGVARVLRTRIYTVDSVEVIEVVWNNEGHLQPGIDDTPPSIENVSCTARVKVSYRAEPI